MNSAIICEGSTDYVLLQYYMRKVFLWDDGGKAIFKLDNQKSRLLKKSGDELTILAVGGCSRLAEGLELILKHNQYEEPSHKNMVSKIVIITDHDDPGTPEEFLRTLTEKINGMGGTIDDPKLVVNQWCKFNITDTYGKTIGIELLPMVVPSDEEGAMETFLLNSLSESDTYESEIIGKCRVFVDNVDSESRYLNHRRIITKAKFDTYFSIRTAADQFNQRHDILRNIPWENYKNVRDVFTLLETL